jgi:hypothetical protein
MIVEPAKFILLDSSILGNLARDYFHLDESKRSVARNLILELTRSGCVPFLCWHQFEELIKHKNDDVVWNRIALLKSLPAVAWIEANSGERLGSIIDLLRAECETILAHPDFTIHQVRNATREAIFAFGSGADAIEQYDDIWPDLRPILWEKEERTRENVAISRAEVVDISEEKLSSYLSGRVRSGDDAKLVLASLRKKMTKEISSRGDRRISDPEAVAADFYADIESDGAAFAATASTDPTAALEHLGVRVSDFGPEARMKDVMALSEFRAKLKVVHKSFNIPWEIFEAAIAIDMVPSWAIQNALSLHGQKRNEHKGSELNDRYLASFAPYCALTYVDAQVKEDIRRALPHSVSLRGLLGEVEKVTTLERIQQRLGRGNF